MSNFKFAMLIAIIILAGALRLWNLAGNPPGLTWDEAALGYNAYSILKTGRDEYGTLLPLNFKSFGDYKPGLYIYLDVPFVGILGLNELAVRLPSALFGILGVLGIYLLADLLFQKKWLSLASAFSFAISPWSIQFSRAAFEANVALTLNVFGILFFVKGIRQSKWYYFSAVLFGLSLLTYQSSRVFVPLIGLGLLIIYWKNFSIKKFIFPAIIFGLFLSTLGYTFLSGQTARLQTENYFAYTRSSVDTNLVAQEDGWPVNSLAFQFLHGQWWEYTKGLVERYSIYFSPKVLFLDAGYQQRERVPDLGILYYFDLLLLPLGLWWLVKNGGWRLGGGGLLVVSWLWLAPIPAVLSRDLISALRALNMAAPWALVEGAGLLVVIESINKSKVKMIKLSLFGLAGMILLANFAIYLDRYFVHAPIEYSAYWLDGYKTVMVGLNQQKNNYQNVVVTDVYGQPYIYFLFYNQYPPAEYQKQAVLDQSGVDVGTVRKIDNIEFRHIYWPNDRGTKNSLFIGSLDELPDKDVLPFPEFKELKSINFLDGLLAFREVETR